MKLRICQVMAGDEEGGLETHFVALCNGLAAGGDTITAIAHGKYQDRFDGRVRFRPLDLARGRRNPLLRRALRREIARCAPDVVHAHASKAAFVVAASRPLCPVVGTVHGVKKDLSPYGRFAAVVGVSAGVLAGLDHPRKRVIFNGVPAGPQPLSKAALRERFGIAHGVAGGTPVTLAVGRLVPVKGFDRLIAMWDGALGHLLVLGDGPERPRLARLAAGKPVTLAGHQADARALMGGADLVVFASAREGLSLVLVEALRARVPVVSTPVPGAVDLLPPSQLAAAGELRDAIAACLADLDAVRARMRPVFDCAARTLTVERMVAETRRVYEEVLLDRCSSTAGQAATAAKARAPC